jgi:hypothetical protein
METTLADPPGARTAVKTGARLHAWPIGFIASVSIIGLACKPRSGFQLCEIKGVKFPANAWSKAPAATLRKARLEMKGVLWRQPAKDNSSCHGSRLTSNMRGRWPRNHLSRRPTARSQAAPSARQAHHHWRGRHLPNTMAWSVGFDNKKRPPRNCSRSPGAIPGFAARIPSGLPLSRPSRIPSVRWRGHLRGRALKDS